MHTRHRRTTIKAKEQHSKQKGQSIIENPEIYATLGTRRNEEKQSKNTIQKTEVAINNKQSRDTDNIGHTRHRRTTIKAKEQHNKQKGKSIIENPEIQATLGTRRNEEKQSKNTIQKTEVAINNKQSRDTGNIGHTTHRRTTIKAKEQHRKLKGKSIIENPEIQATLSTRRNEDKQNKTQYRKLKWQSIIYNPEIQATLGTQHTEGRQSKQRNNTTNRRESQ